MAKIPPPPWLDQVLFNLQDPKVHAGLNDWEKAFVESISQQYANWKASESRMPFGSTRQREALLTLHQKHCPIEHRSFATFEPFGD